MTKRQKHWVLALVVLAVVAVRRCDFDRLATTRSADLPETCRVARFSDGDSLTCSNGARLRLIGIDAPELDQPPFGHQSQRGLEAILGGRELRLEYDAETRDDFDRLLAYAWIDSELVNEKMVRRGWAVAFHVRPNTRYSSRFRSAEDTAKTDRVGLWASGGFECRPIDHRQNRC